MASEITPEATGGFCENCVKGYKLDGTPTGTEKKIGSYETVYVAEPATPSKTTAIVLFTDVFGLKLVNNKLIADMFARDTGLTVYVPDLFHGQALAVDALKLHDTPDEIRNQSFFGKIKHNAQIIKIVPWFLRNKPSVHIPAAMEFLKLLKGPEFGYTKLGATGYCYGASFITRASADQLIDAGAIVHPGGIKEPDVEATKTPLTFALAELDPSFGDELIAACKAITEKKGQEAEFVVWPGTTHGFAARGNMKIESVRKGFEGATAQQVAFLKKHLLA